MPKENGSTSYSILCEPSWTSPSGSINETLFSLVYECKAMITIEIKVPTMRLVLIEDKNALDKVIDLILAEEKKDEALRRMIKQKRGVEGYYNKDIWFKSFSLYDWVCIIVFPNKKEWR